ncbi:MAG TPA: porin, partial [Myxococcus sp.]|nr:porin [Myxococcus sp.]
MRNVFIAALTLLAGTALAQQAESPAPAASEPAAESRPAESTPEAPPVDERLTTAEGKVAALEEQNTET